MDTSTPKRCPRCDRRYPPETEYCSKDGTILYVDGTQPPLPPRRDKRGRLLDTPALDVDFTGSESAPEPGLSGPTHTLTAPAGSFSGASGPAAAIFGTAPHAVASAAVGTGAAIPIPPGSTASVPLPVAVVPVVSAGGIPVASGPVELVVRPRALAWVLPAAVTVALLLGAGIGAWYIILGPGAADLVRPANPADEAEGQPGDAPANRAEADRDEPRDTTRDRDARIAYGSAEPARSSAATTAAAAASLVKIAPAKKPAVPASGLAGAATAAAAPRPTTADGSARPGTVALRPGSAAATTAGAGPATSAPVAAARTAGATAAPAPASAAVAAVGGATVRINSATQAELESLPGIGPAKARAIIEYRETNGGFKSVDELVKVKGIGPKTMETLRPRVAL